MIETHAFRAMGTGIQLLGPEDHPAAPAAAQAVEQRFTEEEQRFSRFRSDSELSLVNAAAGSPTPVSPAFAEVVLLALDAAAATEGLFDPTVHDALVAAGYDRDFAEVLAGARGSLHPAVPCGRWAEVEVDAGVMRLPVSVHLDLGGIAKGWTVDLAAYDALEAGLPWALVNAGGDLRLVGDAPTIEIAVEDPEQPERELLRLRLADGALATSSVAKRSWAPGRHHVIDPRTGAPAETDLLQATVWAPTCTQAEILATRALLEGSVAAASLRCAVVTRGGDVLVAFQEAA